MLKHTVGGEMKQRLDMITSRTNRMREFRLAIGADVETAAKACKTTEGAWYRWERASAFPSIPYLYLIEGFLGRSYQEIWPYLDTSLDGLEMELETAR